MELLALCRALDADRTSEGACTGRFIRMLADAGHAVTVLTSDWPLGPDTQQMVSSWPESVRVVPVATAAARSPQGRWNQLALQKLRACSAWASGWHPMWWANVGLWQRACEAELARNHYDLIVTRAAGGGFENHVALVRLRPGLPWVAHYHDPFPHSLYPEPYRSRTPVVASHQERWHRRILASAAALTFPSVRLRDWVLEGDERRHRSKAVVLPHIAGPDWGLPAGAPVWQPRPGEFTLLHAGTLLGHRNPTGLIQGFLGFLDRVPEARSSARLQLLGGVHPRNAGKNLLAGLESHPNVLVKDVRVSRSDALASCAAATAAVVLEAPAAHSPFCPAKLADCLALRKPVLALTPGDSAIRDCLGENYPFLALPLDDQAIAAKIAEMWQAWRCGGLDSLMKPEQVLPLSVETARAAWIGVERLARA